MPRHQGVRTDSVNVLWKNPVEHYDALSNIQYKAQKLLAFLHFLRSAAAFLVGAGGFPATKIMRTVNPLKIEVYSIYISH